MSNKLEDCRGNNLSCSDDRRYTRDEGIDPAVCAAADLLLDPKEGAGCIRAFLFILIGHAGGSVVASFGLVKTPWVIFFNRVIFMHDEQ